MIFQVHEVLNHPGNLTNKYREWKMEVRKVGKLTTIRKAMRLKGGAFD